MDLINDLAGTDAKPLPTADYENPERHFITNDFIIFPFGTCLYIHLTLMHACACMNTIIYQSDYAAVSIVESYAHINSVYWCQLHFSKHGSIQTQTFSCKSYFVSQYYAYWKQTACCYKVACQNTTSGIHKYYSAYHFLCFVIKN